MSITNISIVLPYDHQNLLLHAVIKLFIDKEKQFSVGDSKGFIFSFFDNKNKETKKKGWGSGVGGRVGVVEREKEREKKEEE